MTALTPAHQYPAQLDVVVEAYSHLLKAEHVPAERIVVCGDSAGG